MVNFFLRLQHWQLFLLQFVIPFVLQFILMYVFLFSAIEHQDPSTMMKFFTFFPIIMVITLFGQLGWIYSVGVGMQKYHPKHVNMNGTLFKVFLIIAFINFVAFICFISYLINHVATSVETSSMPDINLFLVIPIFFITNLFSIFCIFYSFYFAAKSLRSAELQRDAYSEHYIGQFFCFWFPIVGIWIIQPVVNKIASGNFEFPNQDQKNNNGSSMPPVTEAKDLLD